MKRIAGFIVVAGVFGLWFCQKSAEPAVQGSAAASSRASGANGADPVAEDAQTTMGDSKSKVRDAATKGPSVVRTTASGLKFQILTRGSGKVSPKATDTVSVDYHGTLPDGTVFDSSVERGAPASFPLSQVIPGWAEGLQLMREGDKFKFEIPAELAYGPKSMGKIPANCTLVFEVELLGIE